MRVGLTPAQAEIPVNVIPAKAGIQGVRGRKPWIPAFAGMTGWVCAGTTSRVCAGMTVVVPVCCARMTAKRHRNGDDGSSSHDPR